MRITYENIKKIVMLILILTPFIDIINGIINMKFNSSLSIGQVIRILILLVSILIILSMKKAKKKWKVISLLSLMFFIIQVLMMYLIGKTTSIMVDISMIMKMYMLISILCMINCCIDERIISKSDIEKVIKLSIRIIPSSILVSSIFNMSFSSYNDSNSGIKGMFIATNTITIVLIILFILSIYFYYSKNGGIIDVIIVCMTLLIIGSKSSFIFAIFTIVMVILFNGKNRLKTALSVIAITLIIVILSNIFLKDTFENIMLRQQYFLDDAIRNDTMMQFLLSGRTLFLEIAFEAFKKSISLGHILWGMGSCNMQSLIGSLYSASSGLKGIEMDLFDIFFSYGLIGVIFTYGIFFSMFRYRAKNKQNNFFINLCLVLILIFSILGGHVFTEAMSVTYVSIILSFKYSINQEEVYEECRNYSSM